MPSRKSTRNPRRYRRRNCIFNSRRRQRQRHQQRHQQRHSQLQRGGADAHATSLSSILPANSFYPYNANTLPNPVDVRAQPMQQQQQPPVYTQMHAHMQGGGRRSNRKKNYAGKQVGCRTLCRSRSKSRSKSRTRHGYRSRSQSGGDSISYLPSDANMLLRSATTFAGNLVSGLKGEPGSPSPLPFEDQSIQNPRSL